MSKTAQRLHSSHVIANHILVSFHVAFISSLLNIPPELYGPGVLKFVFVSYETIISALFWLITFHTAVAIHEMGHYLKAVKVNALKESLLPEAKKNMAKLDRLLFYCFIPFATINFHLRIQELELWDSKIWTSNSEKILLHKETSQGIDK